jgi:Fe-S-cluster containining protein
MITRLTASDAERIYDDEVGRFVEASAIPCHQCGVCCERWQPLVGAAELERLAGFLGMSAESVRERYTETYPFDDSVSLIRQQEGACVFLRREASGRSLCSVHPARPEVCRSWTASLDRRECVDGLSRFASASTLVPIADIYGWEPDRDVFAAVVRAAETTNAR